MFKLETLVIRPADIWKARAINSGTLIARAGNLLQAVASQAIKHGKIVFDTSQSGGL
jgi:hypothetical protein